MKKKLIKPYYLILIFSTAGLMLSAAYRMNDNKMLNASIDNKGNLIIKASVKSSSRDFDFFEGSWSIMNHKLKSRLNNNHEWIDFNAKQTMKIILRGIGNTDRFYATLNDKPFEGASLRLFNPKTRLWSIYWADSNAGQLDIPVVGSFQDGIGEFYSKDTYNGKSIIVRFRWDATKKDHPVWSQAFSINNGKTWEWNWFMYCSKLNSKWE